jgi:hypothetical protein
MIELILIGGGALAIWFLGRGPSSGQSITDQGANAVVSAGAGGIQASADLSAADANSSGAFLKTGVAAVGGGASTGVAVGGSAGAAAGAATAAVTAGIGIAIGVAVMLWAKHEARIKGAKNENAAMNIAMPGWLEAIQGIILQYNQGKIDAPTTTAELVALRNLVFTSLQKYNHTPGVDWSGGGGQPGLTVQKYWGIPCDKHCTIGCCLFNNVVGPATNNAVALVLHHQLWTAAKNGLVPWQNAFTIPSTPVDTKYGYQGTPAVVLRVVK